MTKPLAVFISIKPLNVSSILSFITFIWVWISDINPLSTLCTADLALCDLVSVCSRHPKSSSTFLTSLMRSCIDGDSAKLPYFTCRIWRTLSSLQVDLKWVKIDSSSWSGLNLPLLTTFFSWILSLCAHRRGLFDFSSFLSRLSNIVYYDRNQRKVIDV